MRRHPPRHHQVDQRTVLVEPGRVLDQRYSETARALGEAAHAIAAGNALPDRLAEEAADLFVLCRSGVDQPRLDQHVARRGVTLVHDNHVEQQRGAASIIGFGADRVKLEGNFRPQCRRDDAAVHDRP